MTLAGDDSRLRWQRGGVPRGVTKSVRKWMKGLGLQTFLRDQIDEAEGVTSCETLWF